MRCKTKWLRRPRRSPLLPRPAAGCDESLQLYAPSEAAPEHRQTSRSHHLPVRRPQVAQYWSYCLPTHCTRMQRAVAVPLPNSRIAAANPTPVKEPGPPRTIR